MADLRIGIIGAARIAPLAIIKPAQRVPGATVIAIAARDRSRADAYATKHGIPRVHTSYDDVINDPDIDAIYNPLPNGLHAEWTLKAIAAGKHVLCEKPFTANAAEAQAVADAADASDRVVMEAFHYRYHELTRRIRTLVHDGSLGDVTSVQAWLCFPLPKFDDSGWADVIVPHDWAVALPFAPSHAAIERRQPRLLQHSRSPGLPPGYVRGHRPALTTSSKWRPER